MPSVQELCLFRTFQTRLHANEQQSAALHHYAYLFSYSERLLYSRLMQGRMWTRDLQTSLFREVGLHSALVGMAHRQLQARLSSLRKLHKSRCEDLNRRLWRECIRLQVKKTRLLKNSNQIATVRSNVTELNVRCLRERSTIEMARSPLPFMIARLKKTLDRKYRLHERLAALRKRRQDLLRAIHFLKRAIQKIASKLKQAQQVQKKPAPLFGPRKLFLAQFHLEKSGFASQAAWLKAWRDARSNCLFIEGDKAAPCGNRFARLRRAGDAFDLELRLPERLASEATNHYPCKGRQIHSVDFKGLNFHHGRQAILAALNSGSPITIRFHRDQTSWKVSVTIFQEMPVTTLDWQKGALGVDWNAGKIVAAHIDFHGNFIRSFTFACNTKGNTAHQTRDAIRKVAVRIVTLAQQLGVPVVNERLDFSAAKTSKRALSDPRFAKMVASFPYSSFTQAIGSACKRSGIALETVPSFHTTRVGRHKFARRYGLSSHQAAAMVIARRAMKFSEHLGPGMLLDTATSTGSKHPTDTREERKACVTDGTASMPGGKEGAASTGVVSANDAEIMLHAYPRIWWSKQPLHDPSGLSGRSLRYRFSRGSEGWEPRRE